MNTRTICIVGIVVLVIVGLFTAEFKTSVTHYSVATVTDKMYTPSSTSTGVGYGGGGGGTVITTSTTPERWTLVVKSGTVVLPIKVAKADWIRIMDGQEVTIAWNVSCFGAGSAWLHSFSVTR